MPTSSTAEIVVDDQQVKEAIGAIPEPYVESISQEVTTLMQIWR